MLTHVHKSWDSNQNLVFLQKSNTKPMSVFVINVSCWFSFQLVEKLKTIKKMKTLVLFYIANFPGHSTVVYSFILCLLMMSSAQVGVSKNVIRWSVKNTTYHSSD